MKYLILLALLSACSTKPKIDLKDRMLLDLHTNTYQVIPEDCYDDNGEFDENIGHDTLDCGNLWDRSNHFYLLWRL